MVVMVVVMMIVCNDGECGGGIESTGG